MLESGLRVLQCLLRLDALSLNLLGKACESLTETFLRRGHRSAPPPYVDILSRCGIVIHPTIDHLPNSIDRPVTCVKRSTEASRHEMPEFQPLSSRRNQNTDHPIDAIRVNIPNDAFVDACGG